MLTCYIDKVLDIQDDENESLDPNGRFMLDGVARRRRENIVADGE